MSAFLVELDGKSVEHERWKLSAFALAVDLWGIDALWVIDPGKALEGWSPHRPVPVLTRESLADSIAGHAGPIVLLDPRRPSLSLRDFEHPVGALYVFGRDRGTGLDHIQDAVDHPDLRLVHIPAPRDCYGFMAATLVAFDRYTKRRALALASDAWGRTRVLPPPSDCG